MAKYGISIEDRNHCRGDCQFLTGITGSGISMEARCSLFLKKVAYPAKLVVNPRTNLFIRSPSCVAVDEAIEAEQERRAQEAADNRVGSARASKDHCLRTCPWLVESSRRMCCELQKGQRTVLTPDGFAHRRSMLCHLLVTATPAFMWKDGAYATNTYVQPVNTQEVQETVQELMSAEEEDEPDPPTVAAICIDLDDEPKKRRKT